MSYAEELRSASAFKQNRGARWMAGEKRSLRCIESSVLAVVEAFDIGYDISNVQCFNVLIMSIRYVNTYSAQLVLIQRRSTYCSPCNEAVVVGDWGWLTISEH